MPVSMPPHRITISALASTKAEVNSDILSEHEIKRGSTIEFIPFEERFRKRVYILWIKPIKKHAIANICPICFDGQVKIGEKYYELSDIQILGVILEKADLRKI